jgi:hypothetical protein
MGKAGILVGEIEQKSKCGIEGVYIYRVELRMDKKGLGDVLRGLPLLDIRSRT